VTNPLTSARPRRAGVTSVLICDDRPLVRAAGTRRVGAITTVADIGWVTDAIELLATFAGKPADLVLIGLRRGKSGGAEAVNELLHRYPAAAVIVFGGAADTPRLAAGVAAGARGVLLWGPNHSDRPLARAGSLSAGRPAATLYPADGFTHGAIGRELSLSEDTVKAHSRRLLRKLGARDRAHAVALGIRKGLVA